MKSQVRNYIICSDNISSDCEISWRGHKNLESLPGGSTPLQSSCSPLLRCGQRTLQQYWWMCISLSYHLTANYLRPVTTTLWTRHRGELSYSVILYTFLFVGSDGSFVLMMKFLKVHGFYYVHTFMDVYI